MLVCSLVSSLVQSLIMALLEDILNHCNYVYLSFSPLFALRDLSRSFITQHFVGDLREGSFVP